MTSTAQPNTRDRLLEAAAGLMWERSFQATGVDEVCERAEAKKGSFYHFFPSKSDLAIAAIEKSWEHVKAAFFEPIFSTDESGLNQLQRLVETINEFQSGIASEKCAVLGCPFGNLGQEMALQDERIRMVLQRIYDAHCSYLETAIERAVQQGEIPPGDNKQRAKNVFALLEGAQLLAKVANDQEVFRKVTPIVAVVAAA